MTDWFAQARFGLFVHWDHASAAGPGAVVAPRRRACSRFRNASPSPVADYHRSAAAFDPVAWDPGALARLAGARRDAIRRLHRQAPRGLRDVPDGAVRALGAASPCDRDLSANGSRHSAPRACGSACTSRCRTGTTPITRRSPTTTAPTSPGSLPPRPSPERWAPYLEFLRGQLRELLTEYGPIDVLWFDGGWERPAIGGSPRRSRR